MELNLITTSAVAVGVLCVILAVYSEVARRRRVAALHEQGQKAQGNDITSPLLAGCAIVALAVAFYTLNRVDRAISRVSIEGSTKCTGATFSVPHEAIAAENVLVTIGNVSDSCKSAANNAELTIDGVQLNQPQAFFSLRSGPISAKTATYDAWLPNVSAGPSTVEVFVPDRHPTLTGIPIAASSSSQTAFSTSHIAVLPIRISNGPSMPESLAECAIDLYYPNTVSKGSQAIVDASIDESAKGKKAKENPYACGDISDAQLWDENGKTINQLGTYYDARGAYVRWTKKIDASTTLWLKLSGASPGGGADVPLLVKTRQSFSGIASYLRDMLAALTAVLGVLVTVVGYLRGTGTNPPSPS